jgi:hypothetical protein
MSAELTNYPERDGCFRAGASEDRGPPVDVVVPDAVTATDRRPLKESPAALARRLTSSAPIGFFCLSSLHPATCFLRETEQASRLSHSALCCTAFATTGTKTTDSFSARRTPLRFGGTYFV